MSENKDESPSLERMLRNGVAASTVPFRTSADLLIVVVSQLASRTKSHDGFTAVSPDNRLQRWGSWCGAGNYFP